MLIRQHEAGQQSVRDLIPVEIDPSIPAAEIHVQGGGKEVGRIVNIGKASDISPTSTLIQILQVRLDKSAEDWRNTRTHQMNLIREAETGIWEEALKLAKEHAPSKIPVNEGDIERVARAMCIFEGLDPDAQADEDML